MRLFAVLCCASAALALPTKGCQRCSSLELTFLELGSGPDTWAMSLERAIAPSAADAVSSVMHDAMQESGERFQEKMQVYYQQMDLAEAGKAAAEKRQAVALDGVKASTDLMTHLREQIADAELRLKRLRDPAPLVPAKGDFRLYFTDPEALGDDDKKVVATVLKRQHPDAQNLTCVCNLKKDAKGSTLGPVLGGLECDCQDDTQDESLTPEEEAVVADQDKAEAEAEAGAEAAAAEAPAAPAAGGASASQLAAAAKMADAMGEKIAPPAPAAAAGAETAPASTEDAVQQALKHVLKRPTASTSIQVGKDRINLQKANVIHIRTVTHGPKTASSPPEVDVTVKGQGLRKVPVADLVAAVQAGQDPQAAAQQLAAAETAHEAQAATEEAAVAKAAAETAAKAAAASGASPAEQEKAAEEAAEEAVHEVEAVKADMAKEEKKAHEGAAAPAAVPAAAVPAASTAQVAQAAAGAVAHSVGASPEETARVEAEAAEKAVEEALEAAKKDGASLAKDGDAIGEAAAASALASLKASKAGPMGASNAVVGSASEAAMVAAVDAVNRAHDAALDPEAAKAAHAQRVAAAHAAIEAATRAAAALPTGPSASTGPGAAPGAATGPAHAALAAVHEALAAAHEASSMTGLHGMSDRGLAIADVAAETSASLDSLLPSSATGLDAAVDEHRARLETASRIAEKERQELAVVTALHARVAASAAAKKAAENAAGAAIEDMQREVDAAEKEAEEKTEENQMKADMGENAYEAQKALEAAGDAAAEGARQAVVDPEAQRFRQTSATLEPASISPTDTLYLPDGSAMTDAQKAEYLDMLEERKSTMTVLLQIAPDRDYAVHSTSSASASAPAPRSPARRAPLSLPQSSKTVVVSEANASMGATSQKTAPNSQSRSESTPAQPSAAAPSSTAPTPPPVAPAPRPSPTPAEPRGSAPAPTPAPAPAPAPTRTPTPAPRSSPPAVAERVTEAAPPAASTRTRPRRSSPSMFRDAINDQLTLDPFEEADETADEKELDVVERDAAMGLKELEMMAHDRATQDAVASKAVSMLGDEAEDQGYGNNEYRYEGGSPQQQQQSSRESPSFESTFDYRSLSQPSYNQAFPQPPTFDSDDGLPMDMQMTLRGMPQLTDPLPDAFNIV